jgi:hypothetical protein
MRFFNFFFVFLCFFELEIEFSLKTLIFIVYSSKKCPKVG